eukprot:Gregarina_sp_Poly_1__4813@NODE_2567_length_1973_cov_120_000525_g1631_i0_p1_GENE_NODE_2567_length_1973_cov_120_000525_g1631_i0NODE_2567_length_1973_cov_120_000525_g1631_i0_p1_ORF_typecomplete_len112_score16_33_NODE_2567_length_1973_cov_120_000525_g1631_i0367702
MVKGTSRQLGTAHVGHKAIRQLKALIGFPSHGEESNSEIIADLHIPRKRSDNWKGNLCERSCKKEGIKKLERRVPCSQEENEAEGRTDGDCSNKQFENCQISTFLEFTLGL